MKNLLDLFICGRICKSNVIIVNNCFVYTLWMIINLALFHINSVTAIIMIRVGCSGPV